MAGGEEVFDGGSAGLSAPRKRTPLQPALATEEPKTTGAEALILVPLFMAWLKPCPSTQSYGHVVCRYDES
jgi:hypothetical protein